MRENDAMHTFCVCAYKESEYLEECVKSLLNQTLQSKIIMVTSTPNAHIEQIANQYNIELFINDGERGITQDWNFGLSKVDTPYATVAHQDDVYFDNYTLRVCESLQQAYHPLIAFTDYYELRDGNYVHDTTMLKIKRFLLLPLRIKGLQKSRFIKRRVLSMGDPICCPAVTFCLDNVQRPIFQHGFRSCEDWEAWEKISREKGSFSYVYEPLMCHRIHEDSATTAIIKDNARVEENFIMFCKFWPKWIAKIINHFYTKSEKSNSLE